MMKPGGLGYAVVSLWVAILGAQASPAKSVWDGVYTKEQGRRGELASGGSCDSCHGEKLVGSDLGPPLRGDDFLATWKGRNTAELFERIRSTMPTDSPGSLSGQRYLDIVAYILSANGFPAGESELPPDPAVLRSIVITGQKP